MAEKAEIVITAKDQTAGAFGTASKNLQGLATSLPGIATRLAGIGAAIAVAAEAFDRFNPKPIFDQADALNKLTQRTGIAVETLSAYQYAAKLADVSNEDLALGLKKLSLNAAAAARGETEQAAAFKAIGVSVVDATGKVRSTDKVLEDIAERISGYNDGANKNALANATIGKGFDKLIPLLNGGKKGLQDAREELEAFGGVISGDLAKKSEEFNDNLTKLEQAGQKLKILLAGEFIDSLVEVSGKFVQAAKDGRLLFAVLGELNSLSAASAGANVAQALFGKPTEIDLVTESARHLNQVLAATQELVKADPGNNELADKLARVKKQADAANESLRGLKIGGGRGTVNPNVVEPQKPPAKKDAPPLPDSAAAANAAALLKAQLDGRIKAIQAAIEREQDLFKFADSKLQELYDHGDLSIDKFYDAKNKAQLDSLVALQKGFDAEIAAQKDFIAKSTKPQDKQAGENAINDILVKQAKAYREAGQAAEVAEQQRVRATEEFQKSLKSLDAQLAELSGDKYGAELLRNAQAFDDAAKLLNKGGADNGRAQELKRLSDLQAALNEQQRQYSLYTQQAQNAEDRLALAIDRDGTGRDDAERQLGALRTKSLEQLDQLIAKQEKLVAATTDPSQIQALDDLRLAREKAFAVVDPGKLRFDEDIKTASDALAQSIEDSIIDGSAKGFKGLGKNLERLVTQDLVTKPLSDMFSKALKDIGAGGEGGGFSKLFSGAAQKIGILFGGGDSSGLSVDKQGSGIDAIGAGFSQAKDSAAANDDSSSLGGIVSSLFGGSGGGGQAAAATSAATALTALTTAATTAAAALSALGGGSAAKEGGGWLASLFGGGSSSSSSLGNDVALAFHSGGVVGRGGSHKSANAAMFRDAPRYHGGGIAGLAPDERPAILRSGEEVLRANDPRHRDNMGGPQIRPNGSGRSGSGGVTIVQNFPQTVTQKTAQQTAGAAGREVSRSRARGGAS